MHERPSRREFIRSVFVPKETTDQTTPPRQNLAAVDDKRMAATDLALLGVGMLVWGLHKRIRSGMEIATSKNSKYEQTPKESAAAKAARLYRERERTLYSDRFPNRLLSVDTHLAFSEALALQKPETQELAQKYHDMRQSLRTFQEVFTGSLDKEIGKKQLEDRNGIIERSLMDKTYNEDTQKYHSFQLGTYLQGPSEAVGMAYVGLATAVDEPGVYIDFVRVNPLTKEGLQQENAIEIRLGKTALRELYSAEPLPPLEPQT